MTKWRYDVRSMPLDVAPMYRITGELTRDGFAWEVIRGPGDPGDPPPPSFKGAEVKVSYRFNQDEKSALDEAVVRVPFEGAKRLELDPIAVRARASRAPEVAAATTFEAKVEAFVRRSGVPWTPGLETKLALLQQPDGGAFLTTVQQSLSDVRQPNGELPVADADRSEVSL